MISVCRPINEAIAFSSAATAREAPARGRLVLHSLFRVYYETLRGDPRLAWMLGPFGTVSFNQVAAVAVLTAALGASALVRRHARAPVPESD